MAFTFHAGANSHFFFRMKNTSGCSHVGFFAAFTMCLLKKAKKVALSISVLCICCSLNWKDRNGACYFEDVSPGIPARAGAVPVHHHLARVAIPEPCLGVRWTWSEIWAMKRLCLTGEMEVDGLWNKDHVVWAQRELQMTIPSPYVWTIPSSLVGRPYHWTCAEQL